ncbi:hypothetical protein FOA52_002315 [Chlamydomonas sp. UWO 241]|nr:hypothetical protein FOA52_002315 [Chlamydomonas sp. UWO 241]
MRSYALLPGLAVGTSVLLTTMYYSGPLVHWASKLMAQYGRPAPRSGDKYLCGNFAPVSGEVVSCDAIVEQGAIPKDLEGVYLRNGPNPLLAPTAGYHWFDGDGMLHATRIKGGKATYSNKWIETSRLRQEQAAGDPLFLKLGDQMGVLGLVLMMLGAVKSWCGLMSTADGTGQGNTALALHANRILALHEADMPYHVRVLCSGVVETIGRLKLAGATALSAAAAAAAYVKPGLKRSSSNASIGRSSPPTPRGTPKSTPVKRGKAAMSDISDLTSEASYYNQAPVEAPPPSWGGSAFTAHPKVDAATGEMMFIGYDVAAQPHCRAGVLTPTGELSKAWDIELPWPTMMHDMVATASYVVIMHMPLVFNPKVMVTKNQLPFVFESDKPSRIGLLPRNAQSSTGKGAVAPPIQWFELPSFYAFHMANAWEEADGTVRIVACHLPHFDFAALDSDTMLDEQRQSVYEYTLVPSTGLATMRQISDVCGDFPVVHPALVCHKARYTWVATMGSAPGQPVAFTGIAKVDMSSPAGKDGLVGTIKYPKDCYGGEAVFVPKTAGMPKRGQEDDGWLLVYVHDEGSNMSKLYIYNAKTMDAKPVAVLRLPARVPYGFHGMFVDEASLAAQLPADA